MAVQTTLVFYAIAQAEGMEITEEEYRSLHEKLYDAYNENRLLKAPRLGTYEKTN